MSKLFGAVIDFCTWAFVPISWTLNLTPRSFSACCSAPGGHSTPSEIMLSVPVYCSALDVPPAAGPARAPRPAAGCGSDATLDKEVAPAHPELPWRLRPLRCRISEVIRREFVDVPELLCVLGRIELVVLAHGHTPFPPPCIENEQHSAAGHPGIVTPQVPHMTPEQRMTLYTTAGSGSQMGAEVTHAGGLTLRAETRSWHRIFGTEPARPRARDRTTHRRRHRRRP